MTRLCAAIAIVSLIAASSGRASAQDDFEARDVHGEIFARRPWGEGGWGEVTKGTRWERDSLIRVSPGASVSFVAVSPIGSKRLPSPLTIDVRSPMLLRLSPDALRHISISKDLTSEAGGNADPAPVGEESFLPSLNEAWNRLSVTMRQSSKDPENTGKNPISGSVGGSSAKLELMLPTEDIVMPRALNAEVRVSWKAPRAAEKSGLRIITRRQNEKEQEHEVEAGIDHHYLKTSEPGTYFVRIESVDGKYRSIEHELKIQPSPAVEDEQTVSAEDAKQAGKLAPKLKLSAPRDGFRLINFALPAQIVLRWRLPTSSMGAVSYELVVTDAKGIAVARRRTRETQAAVSVAKPGRYLWHVDVISDDADPALQGKTTSSATWSFEVRRPAPADLKLSELVKSRSSVAVYVDRP